MPVTEVSSLIPRDHFRGRGDRVSSAVVGRNVVAILGAGPMGKGREERAGGGGGAECECGCEWECEVEGGG